MTYFDQQSNRFIYKLVTKRQKFDKPTHGKLELSLQRDNNTWNAINSEKRVIRKLGGGYEQIPWPAGHFDFFQTFCRAQEQQKTHSNR